MLRILLSLLVGAFALASSISAARAQESASPHDSSSSAPYPPLSSIPSGDQETEKTPTGQIPSSQEARPDTRPLTGAQNLTLGSFPTAHCVLVPSIRVTSLLDKNGLDATNSGKISSLTNLFGSLAWQRSSRRSQMTLNYAAGGALSNSRNYPNSVINQLDFTDTLNWRRWALLLSDQLSYLPESAFGFSPGVGFGPLGGLGLGGGFPGNPTSLQPLLVPNQSILTPHGSRISNAFVTQANYQLSPRSTIVALGSYGILRFLGSGLLDSSDTIFQAGYNYALTRRDTLGVLYRFGAFRYSNFDQAIDDHVVQLAYGRRVTGRLAFQLAAGEGVDRLQGPGQNTRTRTLWNLDGSLHYQFRLTYLALSFDHYVTGGSGVLAGAETSQVQTTVGRSLSRNWQGSFNFGYANNQSLSGARLASAAHSFNTWYGSVQFGRQLGHSTAMFFAYNLQLQGGNAPICSRGGCGSSLVRHQISVGLSWHPRPIAIR